MQQQEIPFLKRYITEVLPAQAVIHGAEVTPDLIPHAWQDVVVVDLTIPNDTVTGRTKGYGKGIRNVHEYVSHYDA